MLLWLMAGVSAVAVTAAALREKRPLAAAGLQALCGGCALGLVNVAALWTGRAIALNFVTAFVSAVLGIPGVILLVLAQMAV